MDIAMTARIAWEKYWVEGASFQETAAELGIAMNTLYRLWESWGYPKRRPGPRGRVGALSDTQVEEILERIRRGANTQTELAREFGVSRQRINQLSKQLSWRSG